MSEFMVTTEKLINVHKHPNADRLEIGELEGFGFQFIIPKGQYLENDLVVYFPVDAVLPFELLGKIGLEGKLAGKDKNRVKTIKLRGEISQGIVADFNTVHAYAEERTQSTVDPSNWTQGTDITDVLGVHKYEVEDLYVPSGKSTGRAGWLKPLPSHVFKYDIESVQRNLNTLNMHLYNQAVFVTEKLEGSHFALSVDRDMNVIVCQRNYAIDPEQIENHLWVNLAIPCVHRAYQLLEDNETATTVTLRGEVLGPGVQGNIYKLDTNEIRFFEIEFDSKPVNAPLFVEYCMKYDIPTVPILYAGSLEHWCGDKDIVETSNGMSNLKSDILREGIVIKPFTETWISRFGRLILKIRSPQYLAESEL